MPTIAPTIAPAYGPAISPTRNDPSIVRSSGVVAEQQARDDAGGQRDAEAEGERQPVGPGAALEDEDVPEPPVAHQHGRQGGRRRQLDDQRGEQ